MNQHTNNIKVATAIAASILLSMLIGQSAASDDREPIHIEVFIPLNDTLYDFAQACSAVQFAMQSVAHFSLVNKGKMVMDCHVISSDEDFKQRKLPKLTGLFRTTLVVGPVVDLLGRDVMNALRTWNVPTISIGANVIPVETSTAYNQLTLFGPMDSASISMTYVNFMKMNGWKKIKFLLEETGQGYIVPDICRKVMDASLKSMFHDNGIEAQIIAIDDLDLETILQQEVANKYGVVGVCASPKTVRNLMIKVDDLGLNDGDYVFFNMDLFSDAENLEMQWYNSDDTEDQNNKAASGYQALKTVALKKPRSMRYKYFSRELKQRIREMYADVNFSTEQINLFVSAYYDAVLVYAASLNVTETYDWNDGKLISQKMRNMSFSDLTSNAVKIDEAGSRVCDYSILSLNPTTNKFVTVANGNRQQIWPIQGMRIYWAGGLDHPPSDTPKDPSEEVLYNVLGKLTQLENCGDPQPYWIIELSDQERRDLMKKVPNHLKPSEKKDKTDLRHLFEKYMTPSGSCKSNTKTKIISSEGDLLFKKKMDDLESTCRKTSQRLDDLIVGADSFRTAFYARASDDTIKVEKGQILQFSNGLTQKHKNYDPKSGVYTVPETGIYRFYLYYYNTNPEHYQVALEAGSFTYQMDGGSEINPVVSLAVDDEVKVVVISGGGLIKTLKTSTFAGYLMWSSL